MILFFMIVFLFIIFLYVVVGEFVLKILVIDKIEVVVFVVVCLLYIFYKVMFLFIWILNGFVVFIVCFFGLELVFEYEIVYIEDELKIIVGESYKSGEIN